MAEKKRRYAKMVWVRDKAGVIQKNTGAFHAIAGAVLMFVANSDFVRNNSYVQKTWWLVPVVMLIAGMLLYRRGSKYGAPLLVAGAMLLVLYWQQQKAKTAAGSGTSTDTTKGSESEVVNNGVRFRLSPDGVVTVLSGDTGSMPVNDQRDVAQNMSDAVFRHRRAA